MATNPGIHPSVDLEREGFPLDERRIVYALAKYFYVTRAGKIDVKNANYRYLSVRPAYNIEHALPHAREIIVLFSPYENFEARTLDAYNAVVSIFEDNRINAHFRILCSMDSDILKKLQIICDAEPDIPVTIPFMYSKLAVDDVGPLIVGAVRENYHFRDLFAQRDPLREDTFFFGRSDLLAGIRDRNSRGENSGIFGLRKSGKTSVLLAIERQSETDGHRYIHIDCQSTAVTSGGWNDLLKLMAERLRKAAGLATTPLQMGEFTKDKAAASFEKSVNDAYSIGRRRAIFSFDEIEHISPQTGVSHWKEGNDGLLLWQTIRSIHQRIPSRFNFVIAGTNPVLIESRKLCETDNPLLEYVHNNYIGGLRDIDVKAMCEALGDLMGMNFDLSAINSLYLNIGGHAYLTRQVCSHIHKSKPFDGRPVTISAEDVDLAIRSFNFSPLLDDILLSLRERYPDEYTILEWLSLGDTDQIEYFIKNDPAFVKHLQGYGLVDVRDGTLRARMALATEYLRRSAKQSGLVKNASDRWGVIAKRRGEVEVELRRIARNRLIDLYGKPSAVEGLCRSLTKIRSEQLSKLDLEVVFSESDGKLYWTDIIMLVRDDRDYWSRRLAIEPDSLLSALNYINDYRSDAHAKTLLDEEFDRLMGAIDSLIEAV